jgi:hypothetical protein
MTDPDDPSRLSDPTAPAGLRDVLRAAQADVGTDAQLARLAQRLGPMLGPAIPAGPAAPAAAGLSSAAKLGLASLALIAAGGGAWLVSASHPAGPPPAPTPTHAVAPPSADVKPPAAFATPTPTAPASEAIRGDASPLTAPSTTAKLPTKPTPPARASEAELLEQARAAMKVDPARALQRANEHAAHFPGGVLVQEREVIAIQALRKLGRSAEADRRATAFAKAFPGSAFARKLNASP